ncbi:hypothetical protein QZH41_014450 [Actinostola sp. cb2023]|nr:hypothetical protein QZH41_014450 [Actinostola sp. cb2023]
MNERLNSEKKQIREELMEANVWISDLEVKYDFECQQKNSLESQLSNSLRKIKETQEKVWKLEQENIEKQLAMEVGSKELKDKANDYDQLKASKQLLEEQNENLRITLKEKNEEEEKKRQEQVMLQEEMLSMRSSASEHESQLHRSRLDRQCTQDECQSYMTRISTLEQKIADLSKEREHSHETIQSLKDTTARYRDEETDSEKRIAEFQRKSEKLHLELSRKDETVQDLKDNITAIEKELNISKQAKNRLEKDCASLINQKNDIELELRSLKSKDRTKDSLAPAPTKRMVEEDVTSKKMISELQNSYEDILDQEKELQSQLTAANAEASKWQSLYNTTNARKIELEDDVASMNKEYGPVVHKELLDKLDNVNLEYQKVTKKNAFLEEELGKSRKLKEQLVNQVNEQVLRLSMLDNQARTKGPTVGSPCKRERIESWPEKKKMEEEADRLRQELKDLQVSLSSTSKARDEAEKQIFHLKSRENETSAKLKCCQEETDQVTNELKTYRQKLYSIEEELQQSISEQSITRTEKKDADKQLMVCYEESTTLHKELSSSKSLSEIFKKELSEKADELDTCKTKMAAYVKEIATLNSNIANMRVEHEYLQKEVTDLTQKIHEKDEKISRLENALEVPTKCEIVCETLDALESSRQVENQKEHIASLRVKISRLEAHNQELEKKHSRKESENYTLTTAVSRGMIQSENLHREKAKIETELAVLKTKTNIERLSTDTPANEKDPLKNEQEQRDINQLKKEIEEIKDENVKLKVEVSHLQAKQALLEIQQAAYKNLEANKDGEIHNVRSKNIEDKSTEELQPGNCDLECLGEQYSLAVGEIMALSRQLQNYRLNVSEWNANHNKITVSNERLQSAFSALQALYSDLNASYEELKAKLDVSDITDENSNTGVFPEPSKDEVDGANSGQRCHKPAETNQSLHDSKGQETPRDSNISASSASHSSKAGEFNPPKVSSSTPIIEEDVVMRKENSLEATDCSDFTKDNWKHSSSLEDEHSIEDKERRDSDNELEIQTLRKKIAKLESSLEEAHREKHAFTRQVKTTQELQGERQTKEANSELRCREPQEHAGQHRIDELINEKDSLIKMKLEAESEFFDAKEKITKLQACLQNGRPTNQQHSAQQNIPETKTENNSLEKEKENLNPQIEKLSQSIEELQQENRELKLKVEMSTKNDGQSHAVVGELRLRVAKLRNELQTNKTENLFVSRKRYKSENRSREINNNQYPTSRYRSTPKPSSSMTSDQESVTSDISSSNLTDFFEDNLSTKHESIAKEDVDKDDTCEEAHPETTTPSATIEDHVISQVPVAMEIEHDVEKSSNDLQASSFYTVRENDKKNDFDSKEDNARTRKGTSMEGCDSKEDNARTRKDTSMEGFDSKEDNARTRKGTSMEDCDSKEDNARTRKDTSMEDCDSKEDNARTRKGTSMEGFDSKEDNASTRKGTSMEYCDSKEDNARTRKGISMEYCDSKEDNASTRKDTSMEYCDSKEDNASTRKGTSMEYCDSKEDNASTRKDTSIDDCDSKEDNASTRKDTSMEYCDSKEDNASTRKDTIASMEYCDSKEDNASTRKGTSSVMV